MPLYAKKKELTKLDEELTKKLRKLKLRMNTLEASVNEIETLITRKVDEIVGMKIKRQVLKSVDDAKEDIAKQAMRSVENGYLNFITSIANNLIETNIKKKVKWKNKRINLKDCPLSKINELYDKGWRISFFGKLADNSEDIILFEKPKVMGEKKIPKKKKKNKTTT